MHRYVRYFTTNLWFNNVFQRVGISYHYRAPSYYSCSPDDARLDIIDQLERGYNCGAKDKCFSEGNYYDYSSCLMKIDILHNSIIYGR